MLLENRIALVTGAAGLLGKAISDVYLREGAKVMLADINAARVEALHEELSCRHPDRTAWVAGDQSRPEDARRFVAAAEETLGLPDILANAHGIFPNCPMLDVTVEEWDSVFTVNTRGTMLACQAIARRWVDTGTKGAIVNISSGAARSGRPGGAHYSGSKAAVESLTQIFAMELGRYGIRVNALAPGLVLDEIMTLESHEAHPYYNRTLLDTPLGRTGAPNDIAEAAAFLASERSAWTTGAILEITGGTHTGRTHLPFTADIL